MSGFLNRSFSRREKGLLLLLVVVLLVGLYFKLVHYPIVSRMEEIEAETEETLDAQAVADVRLGIYNDMSAELEEIFAMPAEDITEMPAYDNEATLMGYLNYIFAGTDQNLNISKVQNGNIWERNVRFSFTARSYAQARGVITDLTHTGYRSLLDSLSFAPSGGEEGEGIETGELTVSGSITFYELAN